MLLRALLLGVYCLAHVSSFPRSSVLGLHHFPVHLKASSQPSISCLERHLGGQHPFLHWEGKARSREMSAMASATWPSPNPSHSFSEPPQGHQLLLSLWDPRYSVSHISLGLQSGILILASSSKCVFLVEWAWKCPKLEVGGRTEPRSPEISPSALTTEFYTTPSNSLIIYTCPVTWMTSKSLPNFPTPWQLHKIWFWEETTA